MENNWEEKARFILNKYCLRTTPANVESTLEFGNLVFEATKKECADKAKVKGTAFITGIDKESILNINKPNL